MSDDSVAMEVEKTEHPVVTQLHDAIEIEDTDSDAAIASFQDIISKGPEYEDHQKVVEEAIFHVGRLYATQKRVDDLQQLFVDVRPFFACCAKARTAKIVRTLINIVEEATTLGDEKESANSIAIQESICRDAIQWCKQEKRTFLKQRMQTRMANLLLQKKHFKEALSLISKLLRAVKKFDDKLLITEIEIIESRVHMALENIPKAKGALTNARAAANSIYCPPYLQAEIDQQGGILCSIEGDYKTAFSYFFEAYESYNTTGDAVRATLNLKYMLLSKIMAGNTSDVYSLINGKAGVKYAGVDVEAMRAVADAHKERSIHAFDAAYNKFREELASDPLVAVNLKNLKQQLLESNLLRIIEPFSRVEIKRVAELIDLDADYVEQTLSEMILDKKLNGILDQGSGVLCVFDEPDDTTTYTNTRETIKELNNVVDFLYSSAQKLTTVG